LPSSILKGMGVGLISKYRLRRGGESGVGESKKEEHRERKKAEGRREYDFLLKKGTGTN